MILEGEGKLNKTELDFFLKGNTALDDPDRQNPFEWVSDASWKDIVYLKTLGPDWKALVESFDEDESQWKRWYDIERPEETKMPKEFSKKFTSFQLLLILRVIRPDRVKLAVENFVVEKFEDKHYIDVIVPKSTWLLSQANERTPIIYILSAGADPSQQIRKMADESGFVGKKFLTLSLGQDMETEAQDMITRGSERGYWVLL